MALPLAIFGIENDGVNLAINLLDPVPRGRLPGADRLHVPGREAPARGPGAGRLRDGRLTLPVRRHDRLLDPSPAGVPRGQARARARDPRLGVAGAPARGKLVPELRASRRAHATCAARTAGRAIKDPCESCGKPMDPRWSLCPYCETPTRRAEPEPAATRRPGRRTASRPTRATRPVARSAPDGGSEAEAKPRPAPKRTSAARSAPRPSASRAPSKPPPPQRAKPSDG